MTDMFEHDNARNDELILVDAFDRKIGSATKERAHLDGLLHRAFSVVIMRSTEGGPELLVAKRSLLKYHSGGLWANSCCSHPRVGEDTAQAAQRRTFEELGVKPTEMREIHSFVYRSVFDNGITEYEYDHVFVAGCTGDLNPDPAEASEVRWVSAKELANELADAPETFATWTLTVFPLVFAWLSS